VCGAAGVAHRLPSVANELEFQGDVLQWLDADIATRPHLKIGKAAQEKQFADMKRSDVVIWTTRDVDALAAMELKTVSTDLDDVAFQNDVIKKARRVGAPYCVQWNQKSMVIHKTPPAPAKAATVKEVFTEKPLSDFKTLTGVTKDYVGKPGVVAQLRGLARDLLTALAELRETGVVGGRIVDPSVFVAFLSGEVREIRKTVTDGVRLEAASSRKLRTSLQSWAMVQGMAAPQQEVLYERASAQLTYRVLGQAVFYLAYTGHTKGLKPFKVEAGKPLRPQLQDIWTSIRAVDYEALYADDAVLDTLPLSAAAEAAFISLLDRLTDYDWNTLDAAVLGSVFENLIPVSERDLLGQYFTSAELADLIVAFCVDGGTDTVLDPACGTGEFLVRAYDRLKQTGAAPTHNDRLGAVWGVDVSHFPTELAVINLCRQDFTSQNNFPRVVTSDFFDFNAGDTVMLPPARVGGGQVKVPVTVPEFDALVGNPPYLRWQKLDDLDPAYRARVQKVALKAKVGEKELLDIYVLFFIHALDLLKPGGRVGFVTSSAWLATDYGVALQQFLLRQARIVAVIGSEAEPFFPQAAINTVVTIVEKPEEPLGDEDDYPLRFVSLKKTIADLTIAAGGDRWVAMDAIASMVESSTAPMEDDRLRIRIGSRAKEHAKLLAHIKVLQWNVPMRAPALLLETLTTDYAHA
jgi:methylase of polypeptide subunit release factors